MILRFIVRLGVSVLLLAALAWVLDGRAVVERLGRIQPGWVVLALAISVVQVGLSARRWCFTARRLGMRLPFGAAFREYYLATFLNQVLPGGVLGDVTRAWRQARSKVVGGDGGGEGSMERSWLAVRVVALERISGQVVMLGVAGVSLVFLPVLRGSGDLSPAGSLPMVAVGVAFFGGGIAFVWALRRFARPYWQEIHQALLSRDALPVQLLLSVAVVGSYVAVFWVAARAVELDTATAVLLPLVPLVLVAMLVPVSFAGWGIREGAAALVWGSVGLAPTDGVAASVVYGLLVLVSSLPGAFFLAVGRAQLGRPQVQVEE